MVDRMDKRKPVKLTRSEKKAMRRTEKLAVKLEKEQERADKIRRKKEAKRAAREEKRRKKGSRKSGVQRKDRKPTPNKRIEKKHSYSEKKSSTGKVRCTNVKKETGTEHISTELHSIQRNGERWYLQGSGKCIIPKVSVFTILTISLPRMKIRMLFLKTGVIS